MELLNKLKNEGYFIGHIDGSICKTLALFVDEIGKAFSFPDYYGHNMNALKECINDLDWLKENDYCLVIDNCDKFLSEESISTKESIWEFLDNTRREWASVPNFNGEDQFRQMSDFVVIKK